MPVRLTSTLCDAIGDISFTIIDGSNSPWDCIMNNVVLALRTVTSILKAFNQGKIRTNVVKFSIDYSGHLPINRHATADMSFK